MNKLKDLKAPLLRAFTDEQYAVEFINGKFRLGLLSHYRNIEDKTRQDLSEGYGHFVDELDHHWHTEFGGPIYVLCFAHPDIESTYLTENMGRFILQIDRPDVLSLDIEKYLAEHYIKTFNGVHGRPIAYTKGKKIDQEMDQGMRAELSVTQKPASYQQECEYRFYTILNQDPRERVEQFLDINLNSPLDYTQMAYC